MFIILFTSVMFTASRGTMLSFLIGAVLVILNFVKLKKISFKKILTFTFFVWAAILLFDFYSNFFEHAVERYLNVQDNNLDNGRFFIWEQALDKWKENPIFGYGLGAGYRFFSIANHNTYIEILFNTGLIGAFMFGSFILHILRKTHAYSKPFFYVIVALLVQISFLDALNNRVVWVFFSWVAMLPKQSSVSKYLKNI